MLSKSQQSFEADGKSDHITFPIYLSAATLFFVSYSLATHFENDDAYILFRYAHNISDGKGFVYNLGEWVNGTSSPLYTLLLAGVSAVFAPSSLPVTSRTFGIIAILLSAFLIYRCLPFSKEVRLFSVGLLLFYPRTFFATINGLESPLIVLAFMLGVWAIFRSKPVVLGLSCGLSLFLKVDTVFWVLSVFLFMILYRRSWL